MEIEVGCDDEYGYRDEGEKPSCDLGVEKVLSRAFVGPNGREHEAEVGGTHQHGRDEDDLYGYIVIKAHTGILDAKAAGAACRHAQSERIEPRHLGEFQRNG